MQDNNHQLGLLLIAGVIVIAVLAPPLAALDHRIRHGPLGVGSRA